MSILFTADIQAEWSNLDTCQECWDEILKICKKQRIDTIVILGDGKQAYNPVDIRVVKWWQHAIRTAIKLGIRVLWLLGNHDRVGQYTDADNWLPILRRAGAITFDKPTVYKVGKQRLFMLPFSRVAQTKYDAKKLLREHPDKNLDILCFHQDMNEAKYNQLGGKSDAILCASDVINTRYKFCIGGHIHQPQNVEGNVYYVGSPFCHDWGEVNQRKRYLIIRNNERIESVYSTIPRWFDSTIHGFTKSAPGTWKGARIRIPVSCDASKDYGRKLEKARIRAEKKYKGADIFVVPKFVQTEYREQSISITDSDKRKIKQYLLAVSGRRRTEQLVEYMLEKLSHFSGGLRSGSKIKFIKAKGINFLSFKKVELDLTAKGITLIQGKNDDRRGKSNGSGKTSLVQLFPVAWFGRTFKNQKHDRWSNRWSKESAFSEVTHKTADGKKIKIVRGRRPPLLQMLVNGKDISSGMKSTDREGTQAQIEQVTGFTWHTMANAIYIDRGVSDAFLAGTKAQRTEVLSKFQNLERFDKALRLVKDDYKVVAMKLMDYERRMEGISGELKECKKSLRDIVQVQKDQLRLAKKLCDKANLRFQNWSKQSKLDKLEAQDRALTKEYYKIDGHHADAENVLHKAKGRVDATKEKLVKWKKFSSQEICPTCYQDISTAIVKHQTIKLHKELKGRIGLVKVAKRVVRGWKNKLHKLERESKGLQLILGSLEDKYNELKSAFAISYRNYEKLKLSGNHKLEAKKQKQIDKLKLERTTLQIRIDRCKKKIRIMKYAREAFSRDGIPAFLNEQLCPVLNKAAAYYSELFSDSEVGVQFRVEDGKFEVKPINTRGGSEIDDQSTGERALLGLIASFALREVAPRCNILILDEPGEGLDEQTARQFAKALRHLVKRFKSIYVCTHNVHILSELESERIITVRKHNKISRII